MPSVGVLRHFLIYALSSCLICANSKANSRSLRARTSLFGVFFTCLPSTYARLKVSAKSMLTVILLQAKSHRLEAPLEALCLVSCGWVS